PRSGACARSPRRPRTPTPATRRRPRGAATPPPRPATRPRSAGCPRRSRPRRRRGPRRGRTSSQPEDSEARLGDGRVEGGGDAEAEDRARVRGRDDAVVPEPRRRVVRAALLRFLGGGRGGGRSLPPARGGPPLPLALLLLDLEQDRGRLLSAHDGDPRVRPHPELAGLVGAPAHAVVAGPEAAPDHDR